MSCYTVLIDEFHELYNHCHADCCTTMVLVSYICMSQSLYVIMLFMSLCYLCHYALSSLTTCNVDCCTIMVTVLVLYNMQVVCMPLCLYVILIHVIRLLFLFPSLCNIQGMFNVLID